jgi:hypothetical protein
MTHNNGWRNPILFSLSFFFLSSIDQAFLGIVEGRTQQVPDERRISKEIPSTLREHTMRLSPGLTVFSVDFQREGYRRYCQRYIPAYVSHIWVFMSPIAFGDVILFDA